MAKREADEFKPNYPPQLGGRRVRLGDGMRVTIPLGEKLAGRLQDVDREFGVDKVFVMDGYVVVETKLRAWPKRTALGFMDITEMKYVETECES